MLPPSKEEMIAYKGFNIRDNGLMKTVDDYLEDVASTNDTCYKRVDAERIANARASACAMLIPRAIHSKEELQNLKRLQCIGFKTNEVFAPNRIQLKNLTAGSRVRNLMHGGMLGLLAQKLTQDPSQTTQWKQSNNALCIVQRANSQAGCTHVKWTIPEFQYRFNIGIKTYKKNPFAELNDDETLAKFNELNTAENRTEFMEQCSSIANAANQSRVIQYDEHDADADADFNIRRPVIVDNVWIADFMAVFVKTCSAKLAAVSKFEYGKMVRCMHLVDLYRFIAQTEWMLNVPNMRLVLSMNSFYRAYIERLIYMAEQGIEHSAYMLARHNPEMMTPELHLRVVPNYDTYMTPQMTIQPDDDVFGAMKLACQDLMPAPLPPLPPLRSHHDDNDEYDDGYYYGDHYDDDYYCDSENYDNESDDNENDDNESDYNESDDDVSG